MQGLPYEIVTKIHAAGSDSIVGSNSKDSSGETLTGEKGFTIARPYNRRLKRLIDVMVAVTGLILFPVTVFLVKNPFRFFGHCFTVLLAKKTWVGYATGGKNLPAIRRGILASNGIPLSIKQQLPAESLERIDYWYARDYEPAADMRLIRKSYRRLGSV